ncbi:hypothetical protein D3C87_2050220 [compost metagenome]
MGRIPGVVAFDLQQLDFTAHSGQFSLPGGVGLSQISHFIAASFKLGVQAVLRQLGHGQTLFQ